MPSIIDLIDIDSLTVIFHPFVVVYISITDFIDMQRD
tara:strand:+ start:1269 stop:1379 length:111 start_codon:yes stop_codon:yes gene_type:complete